MRLTRVYRFSASHRLHSNTLSETENDAMYGKCNNPFGHGHNYAVHISVSGRVDASTGRLVEIGTLDRLVQEQVIEAFDHRDMNTDVNDFDAVVPTTENLVIAVERRLRRVWSEHFADVDLDRIQVEETPRNTFELRMT
jgi:6-pyruvoyltetrahydropterin/6-carboxytetrahydropterin synthase